MPIEILLIEDNCGDVRLTREAFGPLIKKDSSLQSIPVFVVSASESEEDVAKSLQDGAEEYLRKPVMWHEFEILVKSVQDFWKPKVNLQEQR